MNITPDAPTSTCPLMADPLSDDTSNGADWFEEALRTEAPVFRPRASTWDDDDEAEEEISDDDDAIEVGVPAEEIEADPFDDFDEEDFDDDFDDDFEEELEDEYQIEPVDDGAVVDIDIDDEEELDDDEAL